MHDIFNINSSNNRIYGEDGDDIFNIIKGDNNMIDGGAGTNTVTGTVGSKRDI